MPLPDFVRLVAPDTTPAMALAAASDETSSERRPDVAPWMFTAPVPAFIFSAGVPPLTEICRRQLDSPRLLLPANVQSGLPVPPTWLPKPMSGEELE